MRVAVALVFGVLFLGGCATIPCSVPPAFDAPDPSGAGPAPSPGRGSTWSVSDSYRCGAYAWAPYFTIGVPASLSIYSSGAATHTEPSGHSRSGAAQGAGSYSGSRHR